MSGFRLRELSVLPSQRMIETSDLLLQLLSHFGARPQCRLVPEREGKERW